MTSLDRAFRLSFCTLLVSFAVACGAGGDKPDAGPGSGTGGAATGGAASGGTATGGTIVVPPEGGAPVTHPLFGAGNWTSTSPDGDPCTAATTVLWLAEGANFPADDPLEAGDTVLYASKVWQYNGANAQTWMLPACTPGAETAAFCATDWGWIEIQTCP